LGNEREGNFTKTPTLWKAEQKNDKNCIFGETV
jgi:hypothetical protein